ncbi:MAG: hypothetical protein GEV10_24825 [Streptosporangiales bacterium]|nr:hypothetical protein [Streptosporangiales bacterium]
MLRLRPFTMHKATSAMDACDRLTELGEDATCYAGGTELLIAMKLGMARYAHLVDVKAIGELRDITVEPGSVTIGAAVTHRQLSRFTELPGTLSLLTEVAGRIGNPRVRTAGTLGGSLCFGEPRSDLAILAVALDGQCDLVSAGGTRTLTVEELVANPYAADLRLGELMTRVRLAPFPGGWRFAYRKIQWEERPLMGMAVGLREPQPGVVADSRLSIGGADVPPQRVRPAEELLRGSVAELPERVTAAAAAVNEATEWVDGDGYSALYKAHLAEVLLRRTVTAVAARSGTATSVTGEA